MIRDVLRERPGSHRVRALVPLVLTALLLVAAACSPEGEGPPIGSISPEKALHLLRGDDPPLFLDVRSEKEFEDARIPGSMNVPHTEVAARIDEIREAAGDRQVVLYCQRGGRARAAAGDLRAGGVRDIVYLDGHMTVWTRSMMPVETGAP